MLLRGIEKITKPIISVTSPVPEILRQSKPSFHIGFKIEDLEQLEAAIEETGISAWRSHVLYSLCTQGSHG